MTFQQRLKKVMKDGNLRIADLSRWFARPHATVSCWVKDGREPTGTPTDVEHIMALTGLLETLVSKKKQMPVPAGLSPAKRKSYVENLRATCFP